MHISSGRQSQNTAGGISKGQASETSIRTLYDMGLVPIGLERGCSFEEYKNFVLHNMPGAQQPEIPEQVIPFVPAPANTYKPFEQIESTLVETAGMISNFNAETRKPKQAVPVSGFFNLPADGDNVPLGSGVTQKLIGRGGMGAVYLIYCEQLESYRAVKVLTPNLMFDDQHLAERFVTEAKIAANMHHQNIVQCYIVGEWNNLPFIEMEYIKGNDIGELVQSRGRLPDVVSSAIAVNVCNGLVHAHKQQYQLNGQHYHGVVHRDLKPANIRMSDTGDVKILDFGIARPPSVSIHTVAGNFTGSIQYAAPEQIELRDIDFRTDVYSFGLVLYEMLSGKYAFPGSDLNTLIMTKLAGKCIPIEKAAPKISPHLARIVKKCMAVDMEDRYASSDILLDAIEDACGRLSHERPNAIVQDWADKMKYDEMLPRTITQKVNPAGWFRRKR